MRMTVIPNVVGALGMIPKGLKNTGGIGNHRKNRDHPDHSDVKIALNTQKSPEDLTRLPVTYMKDHKLKLV